MLSERGKAVFDRLVAQYNELYADKPQAKHTQTQISAIRQDNFAEPPLSPSFWSDLKNLGGEWELVHNKSEKSGEYKSDETYYMRENTTLDEVEFFAIEHNDIFKDRKSPIIAVYGIISVSELRDRPEIKNSERMWRDEYEAEFSKQTDATLRPITIVNEVAKVNTKGYQAYMDLAYTSMSYSYQRPSFERQFVTQEQLDKMLKAVGLTEMPKERELNTYQKRIKDKFERE